MDVDHVRVPAACIGCVTADDVQAESEYRAWIVHVHPECPVHGELVALRAEVRKLREAIVAYVASEDADIWEQERTWEALCAIARATEGEP